MPGYIYQDAYTVWRALKTIVESMSLQQAKTLRFDLDQHPQHPLRDDERRLIAQLSVDKLIIMTNIQSSLDKYFAELIHRDELSQQLKASNARLKTLELRARNLDQELSKSGLFRGKKNTTLKKQRDQVSTHLTQVHGEISGLQTRLHSIEQQRRALGERISTEDELQRARWVSIEGDALNGIVLSLTEQGMFLLNYLSDMSPDILRGKTLPPVLVYGFAWSMANQNL